MKKATSIMDMVNAQGVIIDDTKYRVDVFHGGIVSLRDLDRQSIGHIEPKNKRTFKLTFRSRGFDWESVLKYTDVTIL